MKKKRSLLVPLLCITMSHAAFSQADSYAFKRRLENVPQPGYYSIPLDPDLIARSKSGMSDLRLYHCAEKDSSEIPYLTEWLGDKITERAVPFEIINHSYALKCCSYLTLKSKEKKVINQIRLDIAEDNFDKRVKVEGSLDNSKWLTIAEHLRIVRMRTGTVDFNYTLLNIPESEYNYFRLEFDDDGSKKITVINASAFFNDVSKGRYHELRIAKQAQQEKKKEKISEILVEFPAPYMINYITLSSKGSTDFYRNINIYRSNGTFKTAAGEQEAWEAIGSGVISSEEGNRFQLWNSQTKKLKIEIVNYDDQPVKIGEIKAFSEEIRLLAQLPAGKDSWLFYGKENDNAPVYDLVHFREKIPAVLPNISYGPEEQKTLNAAIPKEALISSKTWLWISMGAVILLMGYFALSMLKKEQE